MSPVESGTLIPDGRVRRESGASSGWTLTSEASEVGSEGRRSPDQR